MSNNPSTIYVNGVHLLWPGSDEEAEFLDIYDGENKLVTHQGMPVVIPSPIPHRDLAFGLIVGCFFFLMLIGWYWMSDTPAPRQTPNPATPHKEHEHARNDRHGALGRSN